MRRITEFVINKRYLILVIFIILSIVCAIVSKDVVINYDIEKYLPSTSETRIGMDIMEKEFEGVPTSSFNIMFKGLKEEEKNEVYNYLSGLDKIDSVEYDETENYNKDDYTLYGITLKEKSDSEIATNVYNDVIEKYKDYEVYTSGDIADRNKPVLEPWIIGFSIACALVILIIMCDSYLEPFLFLITILAAVVLNKGTNIIFDSVSNITQSISAILQLALSMDYSIMLMNRYTQEKNQEKDNVKAMKNALYNAFKSISSSSVTTIVGLIVLVFMSFTIGKDLGLVLAKGVLFSLISIFFVLPGLILMFDKWIVKTKKKSPKIKLDSIGKISYKFRYIAIPLFIAIFVCGFLTKENLGILYTNSQLDKISDVFEENNQIAIIYKNEDEEKIAKILPNIEDEEKSNEVLGYSNTINEKLTYDKLNERLKELDSDVDTEEYLIKIVYYNYYNQNVGNKMTFDDFVKFIKSDVYNNEKLSDKIDEKTKVDIDRLENFVTENAINKQRTTSEISKILDIDEQDVKDILIYYSSKNDNTKISINDFINFINNDVLTDKKYSSSISASSLQSLKTLSKFTNKNSIQTKMNSKQIANLFGLEKNSVDELFKYYLSVNEIDTKMTLSEFSDFVLNNVLTDPNYANSFNEDTISNIKLLSTFSDKDKIKSEMDIKQLSSLFGIDKDIVSKVLLLKYMNTDNGSQMTIPQFVKNVTVLKKTTNYLDDLDTTNLEKLGAFADNETKYTATQLSNILGIPANKMYQIYALIDLTQGNISSWKSTPYDFVELILKNSNNENISANLNKETLSKLKLLSNIMNSSINNLKYSYTELANFIGIEATSVKNIYVLYDSNISNVKLTPQEFVNFVLTHKDDEMLVGKLSSDTIANLKLVQSVMDGVIKNTKYTSLEISNLLKIDKEKANLLYGLYNTKHINTNRTISLKEFINFILSDVITNKEYSKNFDNDKITKLNTVNAIMKATVNKTEYTASEIISIIGLLTDDLDEDMIKVLYIYYGSQNEYNSEWTLTVEEFVKYLNENILTDSKFADFIDDEMKTDIIDGKATIEDAKELLIGKNYSRVIINSKFDKESDETFSFIQKAKDMFKNSNIEAYIIGDSPMAYEMTGTFGNELNFITILTMIAIFIVVVITFKSILIPIILVAIIQCAVYLTMGILSFSGEAVYFISILIVQSILMGATIDYAILYTSYYLEHRKTKGVKQSIIDSYNRSIHTILTSSSILIIVTLIVANFATAIAAKICKTISEGTLCSTILILVLLPAILAACDKFIVKNKKSERRDFDERNNN